jgi:hypothetical protein
MWSATTRTKPRPGRIRRVVARDFKDASAEDVFKITPRHVAKLADTAQRLGAIPHVRVEANHVMIPARGAFNTTLVLSA